MSPKEIFQQIIVQILYDSFIKPNLSPILWVFSIGMALVSAVWGWILQWPGPTIIFASVCVLAVALLCANLVASLIVKSRTMATPANSTANYAEVEFFPTIDSLRSKHPIPETFRAGNEIHAYFLSGEGVFAEHNDYIKCVKRLILPNPDSENIATVNTFSSTHTDYRAQIMKYRALAKRNNIPVRLFQSFTGVSLLFCNPDRQDGWVQVGIIIPGSQSAERQHYRIYRAIHEKAVRSLYETFDLLWDASEEQTEAEAFDEGFRRG
jgi:hypothetical protein